jgi:hypothetical protein
MIPLQTLESQEHLFFNHFDYILLKPLDEIEKEGK